jgi:GT2 family glycosyltransferase
VIVTGAMKDPQTGQCTYGGVTKRAGLFIDFVLTQPGAEPLRCDTTNGNFVIVPRAVARRVGNLSGSFVHQLADFDYGLRAAALGISCWVAPGFVGTCASHAVAGSHLDATLPLRDRIRLMRRPSGPPPVSEWMIFVKRHAGWRWPLYWVRTFVRGALPQLWAWWRSRSPGPVSPAATNNLETSQRS